MSKRETLARYSLIIRKLRNGYHTFKEIQDYLALESEIQSDDFNISERTFYRDKNDILSLYGIEIIFDKSKNGYHTADIENQDVSNRIMEAMDIFNALNIAERLSDFVHLESRAPAGTQYMQQLLHQIKECKLVCFDYQKYWDTALRKRRVEPYGLKEYKNRWYLWARDTEDEYKFKTFALDRFLSLEPFNMKFDKLEGVTADSFFKHAVGIITPDKKEAEEVILSFDEHQGKYAKSLPLHHSQEILIDNENELRIKLFVLLSHDFKMDLLSYGSHVKIIQPEKLKKEIRAEHLKAAKSVV